MFGSWRAFLALEVAIFHLAGVPLIGRYAVGSFFILSGYLMTAVMIGSYGYTTTGRLRFALNRVLRLYPGYWLSIGLTLLLIASLGQRYMASYHAGMQLPVTVQDWVQNVSMLFLGTRPQDVLPRLTPPSWALSVEWLYYLLIGLGLSKSRGLATAWFAASILGNLLIYASDPASKLLYGSFLSGSLGFSAGAWSYHHRDQLRVWTRAASGTGSVAAILLGQLVVMAAVYLAERRFGVHVQAVGDWFNVGLTVLMIVTLRDLKVAPGLQQVDKWLGDLSYPFYLLHWQAGAIASYLLFAKPIHGPSLHGLGVFLVALPIVLLLALPQILLIDPIANRYRDAVRARGNRRRTAMTRASFPAVLADEIV